MAKITTDLAGGETATSVKAKITAILQFWRGSTAMTGVTNWGQVRTLLNGISDTGHQILNEENYASFVLDLNWLNNPDQVIPATIFSGGRQGVWFDPSDFASMFQDGVGSTPVTAPGQSVGTVLDKSKGLALGVEKVTNGDFSGGTTGWVASTTTASISVVGEALRIQSTVIGVNARYAEQTIAGLTVGKSYRLSAVVVSAGGAGTKQIRIDIRTSNGSSTIAQSQTINSAANTTISMVFVATETTHRVWLRFDPDASGDTTSYVDFDNVSVREIAGNHAFQPTASKRPVLTRRPKTGLRNQMVGSVAFTNNTYWLASLTGNGVTLTRLGTGVEDGLPYVEYSANGTATASGSVVAYASTFGTILGTAGVTTVASVYGKIVSGTVPAGCGVRAEISEMLGTTFINSAVSPMITATTITRTQISRAITTNGDRNRAQVGFRVGAGDIIDNVVFRIYAPQHEIGSVATAPQFNYSIYDVTEPGVQDCYGLMFDGVDDFLQTGSIAWGTDEVTITAGLQKLSDAARAMVLELGNATLGSFAFEAPNSANTPQYLVRSTGSLAAAAVNNTFAAPDTAVVTLNAKVATDLLTLRRNGAQIGTSTADQGTGIYYTNPLTIGMRAGTSLPFNGILFGLTAVNAVLDATQLGMVELSTNFNTGGF